MKEPMSDIINSLKEILGSYDQKTKPITEEEIQRAIQSLRDPQDNSQPPMEWVAEVMAFGFLEDYQSQETGWGTYFGPMMVLKNDDGTFTESPSIQKVTPQIIQYWSERAMASKHPVLRTRYADLVWDFSKVVTKTPPHYTMAHIVIDSIIEIAQRNCHKHEVYVIKKLERALSLAVALKDSSRIEKVRDVIISYEDSVTQDSKLGLWGFAYDLLYENDKVKLTTDQEQKLVDDLEGHLLRASQPPNSEDIDPWSAEAAALRLAKYYRKAGRSEDVKRVILEYGGAFIKASLRASALQASAWLQGVHANFVEYGLKDESEGIAIKLRELGEKVKSELKPISHKMTISDEEMNRYTSAIIEGDIDGVFARIVAHYIPKKAAVKNQLKELVSRAPLQFLSTIGLQDNRGRPIAKVGPLEDDLTGHIVILVSQNMAISSVFLRTVLKSLVNKYPTFETLLVDYLFRSPIFEEDKKSIIELGVKAYLNGDYVTAVHLLIPQIENAIRVVLEKAGGSVLKPSRGEGFNLRILDDLLRDPLIVQVFGEDAVFYFRTLLVDQRGWNLRNRVCHGLCNANEFGPSMSDRVMHVLLCLAQVREQASEGK